MKNIFKQEFPDGLIDVNEFCEVYRKFYKTGNPEKYAKLAFKAFDTDNNGKVAFSEFLVATAFSINSSKSDDIEKAYEFAFDVYDVDNNGKVDKNEALTLLKAVYEIEGGCLQTADDRVEELFKKFDADRTGYLNKSEFVQALYTDNYLREIFLA